MRINIYEKIAFVIIFGFILAGVYFSRTDLDYYNGVYTIEDGLIEWLTFIALCMGAAIAFYRSAILKPFRGLKFQLCLIALGLLFLFGAGEEISWGQRIFDYNVPQFFIDNNAQGETNLHNLVVSGKKVNKIVFGLLLGIMVALYLLVFPTVYKKFEKVKKFVDGMAIPVPQGIHVILYMSLVLLAEFIAGTKKGEILEFGGCWIFMLMTLNPLNRDVFSRKSFER